MDLDFKDRTFSFIKLKKKKIRRRITIFSIAFILLVLFLLYKDHAALGIIRNAEESFLKGNFEKSAGILDRSGSTLFRKNSFRELRWILSLLQDDTEPQNRDARKWEPGNSSLKQEQILTFLSDNCYYHALDRYSSALPDEAIYVKFYRIVADSALFRWRESGNRIVEFENMYPGEYRQRISLLKEVNRQTEQGEIDFVFDLNGKPLARYSVAEGKSRPLVPGLYFNDLDSGMHQGLRYIKLSVDRDIQLKLHTLFSGYYGSFILFDLEDGSILACYSKPFTREKENSALSDKYEPGSVVKLITMFAWLDSGNTGLFPFVCRGFSSYDGRIFYDWMKHGALPTPEKALARSCNIAFSEMGIAAGKEKLTGTLVNFLFNSGPMTDENFNFVFGDFTPSVTSRREIANLSIGLENIRITTFHSALLSSIIAQNGNILFPYMTEIKKNIFSLAYYNHTPGYRQIFINNRHYEALKSGMREVSVDPEGTGRRARVDFMETGMKTGTAGSREKGLDSVITGFFPFGKPRYSFAFRLERGGKAEYQGALFLEKFLTAFHEMEK